MSEQLFRVNSRVLASQFLLSCLLAELGASKCKVGYTESILSRVL